MAASYAAWPGAWESHRSGDRGRCAPLVHKNVFSDPKILRMPEEPTPADAQAQAGAVWPAERDGELGALTDPDSWGLRRVSRADAGHSRYVALRGTSGRAGLRVLDSQSRTNFDWPPVKPPMLPSAPGGARARAARLTAAVPTNSADRA